MPHPVPPTPHTHQPSHSSTRGPQRGSNLRNLGVVTRTRTNGATRTPCRRLHARAFHTVSRTCCLQMFTPSAVVPEAVADSSLPSVPVERTHARTRRRCCYALSAASRLDVGPPRACVRVCVGACVCVSLIFCFGITVKGNFMC